MICFWHKLNAPREELATLSGPCQNGSTRRANLPVSVPHLGWFLPGGEAKSETFFAPVHFTVGVSLSHSRGVNTAKDNQLARATCQDARRARYAMTRSGRRRAVYVLAEPDGKTLPLTQQPAAGRISQESPGRGFPHFPRFCSDARAHRGPSLAGAPIQ